MKLNQKLNLLGIKKEKCRYCLSAEDLTLDHKIPTIKGGKDEAKNIQTLCRRCNINKSAHSDKEIKYLARWIYEINLLRAEKGKKPLGMGKLQ